MWLREIYNLWIYHIVLKNKHLADQLRVLPLSWKRLVTSLTSYVFFCLYQFIDPIELSICHRYVIRHTKCIMYGHGFTLSCLNYFSFSSNIWWRHQMETFSALMALCAGYSPVAVEFSSQRPMPRSFDVFFHQRLNKRLSKQFVRLVIWEDIKLFMTSL